VELNKIFVYTLKYSDSPLLNRKSLDAPHSGEAFLTEI
jgi:hypothetical protein